MSIIPLDLAKKRSNPHLCILNLVRVMMNVELMIKYSDVLTEAYSAKKKVRLDGMEKKSGKPNFKW
jgi:hypothetical protein